MDQTPKRAPAKGKGRAQTGTKGCCCKRSQCIKNYCDCYQSMMVCTQFCRCIGCRNTEERMAVEPRTPSRNSSVVKRDRAAAMTAKAAAAAAKEGIKIPVPVPPVFNSSIPITIVPAVQQPTVIAPINIIRMAPDCFNIVVDPGSPQPVISMAAPESVEVPITPDAAKDPPPDPEGKPEAVKMKTLHKTHNLFAPEISGALLVCTLTQSSEAELLALNQIQVGRLAIIEFGNCFKEVLEKMSFCNME